MFVPAARLFVPAALVVSFCSEASGAAIGVSGISAALLNLFDNAHGRLKEA